MFGKVNCIAAAGIDGYVVEVEADVAINLTNYSVIKSFSYETQVFPVKSDLLIDISKNA